MTGSAWLMRMLMLGGAVSLALQGSVHADYTQREDVLAYVDELVDAHDFGREELLELFRQAGRKQSILDAISRPAERVLKWHEYRDIFLGEPRISQGVEFWDENAEALHAAEDAFGVAPEYIVAIIGVETRYGRVTGRYRVLDALMTLGFDYPPRADFFRRELTEFLLLTREEARNPLELTGSYAGAMGFGQFIPSSFRAYAVDFDGDGRRDIWSNRVDAIGSVANYFHEHGWQAGAEVVVRTEVTRDLADIANASLDLTHSLGELRDLGVAINGYPPETRATLYRMEGPENEEYWLGFNNFHVITRYNRSRLYALAVHQLAGEIRHQRTPADGSAE